jgi:carboxymethylenebutenolidase
VAAGNGAAATRTFATGYCWGGPWTWLLAAHRRMRGAVAWYGILDSVSNETFAAGDPLFPRHPIDLVDGLKTPVLGLYGGQDEAIPRSSISAMQTALSTGNDIARQSEIVVYDDAPHAFFADYRTSYDPDASADAWERCVDWMKRRG